MKTIITIALVLLTGFMLTSCDKSKAGSRRTQPPQPQQRISDPVAVLEDQVESERQLRKEAEAKAGNAEAKAEAKVEEAEAKVEKSAINKGNWQLIALGLSVLVILGFFGGTAIGSRGRNHANTTS